MRKKGSGFIFQKNVIFCNSSCVFITPKINRYNPYLHWVEISGNHVLRSVVSLSHSFRCAMYDNLTVVPLSPSSVGFTFRAFYLGQAGAVVPMPTNLYLHCDTRVCHVNEMANTCSQFCRIPIMKDNNSARRRRKRSVKESTWRKIRIMEGLILVQNYYRSSSRFVRNVLANAILLLVSIFVRFCKWFLLGHSLTDRLSHFDPVTTKTFFLLRLPAEKLSIGIGRLLYVSDP